MQSLRAAFDIGDHRDGWLDMLQDLLHTARCQELVEVDLNWKETPVKPVMINTSTSATWSSGDYYDLVFQHRHRQRLFVKFFDLLVASAPYITRLTIPFDWSERSVRAIGRLRRLKKLVLRQYFWMQSIGPACVDQLVSSLPELKCFILEIWSPNAHGLQSYTIRSPSLEYLDVSQCRGLSLGHVYLPRLRTLLVSCQPMSGPLVSDSHNSVDCLLQVLSQGAPALQLINGFQLGTGWTEEQADRDNDGLEAILSATCACTMHRPNQ